MTGAPGKLTNGRELIAYLVAHAVGYGLTVLLNTQLLTPLVYTPLARNRQTGLIWAVNIGLFVVVTIAVLIGFLLLRKAMSSEPLPSSSGVPAPTAPGSNPASPTLGQAPSQSSAGRTLGIISIVCGVLGLLPGMGILISLIGLVLGLIGRGGALRDGDPQGAQLSLIGTILSSITLAIAAVLLLTVGSAMFALFRF